MKVISPRRSAPAALSAAKPARQQRVTGQPILAVRPALKRLVGIAETPPRHDQFACRGYALPALPGVRTSASNAQELQIELIHELLDAHLDTVWLVESLASQEPWGSHLQYLRALQRTAQEVIARASMVGE